MPEDDRVDPDHLANSLEAHGLCGAYLGLHRIEPVSVVGHEAQDRRGIESVVMSEQLRLVTYLDCEIAHAHGHEPDRGSAALLQGGLRFRTDVRAGFESRF